MYLTAIIDLYSRFIVGWQISNSLEKENQTTLLQQTLAMYGKPEIINSDQGSKFTSDEYIGYIKSLETVKISMDGKGRATDNAYIERDKIYLHIPENGQELFALCFELLIFYTTV